MRPILFLDEPHQPYPNEMDSAIFTKNEVEVIYTHFTKVQYDLYPNLKVVLCPCTGIKHLNPESQPGIRFINLTDKEWLFDNVLSTAEWTVAAMFKLLRRNKDELNGKTIGFIGFGRVAQQVTKMLSGFNVNIKYYDIETPKYYKGYAKFKNPISVLDADIISVHLSENESTENFVNDALFDAMQTNSKPYFINSSRSSIVDGEYLVKSIAAQRFSGVMLDVVEDYSSEVVQKLLEYATDPLYNVFVTPHQAGKGEVSRRNTDRYVFQELEKYYKNLKGEMI